MGQETEGKEINLSLGHPDNYLDLPFQVLCVPTPHDYLTCRTGHPGQTVSFQVVFPPSAG